MFENTVVCGRIALGIQGEHCARKVSFADADIWKEKFGEGRFELLHQRNGDVAPYPVSLKIENGIPYWYVSASDTSIPGSGKCELRYIVGDVIVKSCVYFTDVTPGLGDGTEPPAPQKTWVDEVLDAAKEIKAATIHQPIIGENGNWFVYDFEIGNYIDTGVFASGGNTTTPDEIYVGDGEMPETATIQIILDGSDEEQALKDELKEYIDTEITSVIGTGEFDGENGATFIPNVSDDGIISWSNDKELNNPASINIKGADGYTPVKGVDYYTEDEKAEWSEYIASELAKRGRLKPEFANSIEECTDTTKLYVLPDGYIYAYIKTEIEGGSINIVDEVGYVDNTRLSTSSDTTKTQEGYVITNAIDVSGYELPIVIRTQGVNFNDGSYSAARLYKTDGTSVGILLSNLSGGDSYTVEHDTNGNMVFTLTLGGYSSIKFGGKGAGKDLIITIDGVVSEPVIIDGWANTGHAFVPADYEDRIVELEGDVSELKVKSNDFDNRISSLEASENGSTPTYVIAEAAKVANKVLSVRNAYSFVFGAMSDIHSTGSDISTLHVGQGIREIDKLTTLDVCLNFGDGIDSYFENINADSFLHIRKCLHSVQREIPYIQMQGNHDQLKTDTTEDAQQKYFAYIGANNIGTVTDWDNRFRNYGYRDFPDQRMRVIYLNSVDVSEGENTDDCWLTAMQLSWLVNTALNFTDKNGWSFIIGCHHPLNWLHMDNLLAILNAYKGKTSGSVTVDGTTVNYNFANAAAEFIAHFHGHLHNFRAETLGSNGVLSITIPNACFGRNNEYGTSSSYTDYIKTNYGDVDENGNQRQFNKTSGTAEDTAFNVVVVDRLNQKLHCFNYGAGEDREIGY